MSIRGLILVALLGGVAAAVPAWACTDGETSWLVGTQNWNVPVNWSNGLPSETRSAVFSAITLPAMPMPPELWGDACELKIRQPSAQTSILVSDAALRTGRALIGETAGSYGKVEVNGRWWWLSARGGLPASVHVGHAGNGELLLRNSAGFNSSSFEELRIGDQPGSQGEVTVRSSSSLPLDGAIGSIDVGRSGTGSLTIQTGGEVAADAVYIARLAGGEGEVSVTGAGSKLTVSGPLHVGQSGPGELDVLDGAVVTSDSGFIGTAADGNGKVEILGTNARWNVSNTLNIGYQGEADVQVFSGARIFTSTTTLGWGSGSEAEVLIGGLDAAISAGQGMTIGRAGTGTLSLFIGAEASVGGATQTGTLNMATLASGTGTLHLYNNGLDDGRPGTLLAGTVHGGNGNATVHFDHLKSGYEFRNGFNAPIVLSGSVNILHTRGGETRVLNSNRSGNTVVRRGLLSLEQGSAGSSTAEVVVGQSAGDDGILRLLNNSILNSGTAVLGQGLNSLGRAAVIGAGSSWTQNGPITVGREGEGELTIRGDATLQADNVLIASFPGSRGVLNIGNGSRPGIIRAGQLNGGDGEAIVNFNHDDANYNLFQAGSPVLLSGSVQVNHRGVGRTRLFGSNQYLGPTLVEQGTLILSDGAVLNTPDRVLNIGEIDQQTGRFEMETEARATVDILRVGRAGGSRGELQISGFGGGDTELRALRTMIIGGGGEGDVDLGETALLIAGSGAIVGRSGPGDGRVSMSDGARWRIEDGGLTIGELGRGEVIVGNGAVLEVLNGGQPGTVLIGAEPNGDGVLRIGNGVSAGTLLAASVIGGPGAAGLAFEHQHADYDFLADGAPIELGGAMDVVHSGSGSTRLFGPQTVNGDLLAAFGGTFILNGQFDFNSFSAAFGGRLAGKGTLSGPVTILPASRLAPGDGIGLMTIQGNLILDELATLEMALADTDPQSILNARLNVNGNLRLNGQLEVTGLPGFGPGRYRLINYSGMLDDLDLEIVSLPPGFLISEASIDTSTPGRVDLIVGGQVEDGLFADRFEGP